MMRYSLSDSAKICFPRKNTCQITWAIYRLFSNHLKGFFFFFLWFMWGQSLWILFQRSGTSITNMLAMCMYVCIYNHTCTHTFIYNGLLSIGSSIDYKQTPNMFLYYKHLATTWCLSIFSCQSLNPHCFWCGLTWDALCPPQTWPGYCHS